MKIRHIRLSEKPALARKPLKITIGILSVVVISQLIITNLSAGKGHDLTQLEKQITQLSRDNENLRQELSSQTSLSNISQRASSLGLVAASQVQYIDMTQPIASIIK